MQLRVKPLLDYNIDSLKSFFCFIGKSSTQIKLGFFYKLRLKLVIFSSSHNLYHSTYLFCYYFYTQYQTHSQFVLFSLVKYLNIVNFYSCCNIHCFSGFHTLGLCMQTHVFTLVCTYRNRMKCLKNM